MNKATFFMKFIFFNTKNLFFTNVLIVHLFFKNKTIEKINKWL